MFSCEKNFFERFRKVKVYQSVLGTSHSRSSLGLAEQEMQHCLGHQRERRHPTTATKRHASDAQTEAQMEGQGEHPGRCSPGRRSLIPSGAAPGPPPHCSGRGPAPATPARPAGRRAGWVRRARLPGWHLRLTVLAVCQHFKN